MLMLMLMVTLLSQLMAGVAHASDNDNNEHLASSQRQVVPGQPPHQAFVKSSWNLADVCQWLCQSPSTCPPACAQTFIGMSSKRAVRARRLDDFKFGRFDDYLFMKLLGRDLGDKA